MTTRDSAVPPTPQTAPQKVDRDAVFYELTRSICPHCRRVIDAQILLRENKVYMRKRCPAHGVVETLVYGDAQAYASSAKFNKPGTMPLVFSTEVTRGCPHDCGLCPEHQQHTCLGIIEVNSACTRYPLSWHRSCSTCCRSKSRPHWLRVSSPRATIEARAMVTPRLHPMQVQGRTVHQIGLPIHFGYAGEVAGSAANELIAIVTDPNVKIHEAKAFTCQVEKGRLAHPSDIPSAAVQPRPRAEPMPGTDRQAQPEGRTA